MELLDLCNGDPNHRENLNKELLDILNGAFIDIDE